MVPINIRPNLETFLQECKQRDYDIFAYTAGTPIYADPVLESIDPDGDIFLHRWYRHNCKKIMFMDKYELYSKDLQVVNDYKTNHYDPKK